MSTSTERAKKHRSKYDTSNEIEYIKSIRSGHGITKMQRLLQYEKSVLVRVEWGDIDPDAVKEAIKTEIAMEQRRIMTRP